MATSRTGEKVRFLAQKWELECSLPDHEKNTDRGKAILITASESLTTDLTQLECFSKLHGLFRTGIMSLISVSRSRMYIDGGLSFRKFWNDGDEAFALLKNCVRDLERMIDESQLEDDILKWLCEIKNGLHPQFTPTEDVGNGELCQQFQISLPELVPRLEVLESVGWVKVQWLLGDDQILGLFCQITGRGQLQLRRHEENVVSNVAQNVTTNHFGDIHHGDRYHFQDIQGSALAINSEHVAQAVQVGAEVPLTEVAEIIRAALRSLPSFGFPINAEKKIRSYLDAAATAVEDEEPDKEHAESSLKKALASAATHADQATKLGTALTPLVPWFSALSLYRS